MFARNVSMHLKPNTLTEFTHTVEKEVIPFLRKQKGFQDEITFAIPGGMDIIAISLWDNKENADSYNTSGYPETLKRLSKVLDGTPNVRISDVVNSTFHKIAAPVAA